MQDDTETTIPLPDVDKKFLGNLIQLAMLRICVVCGKAHTSGRLYTCSEKCHQKFIDELVEKFGEHKKIIDQVTGKAYKVPTRDILEKGLSHSNLPKYPEWKD
jgi:hypothetical protein